MKSMLNIIKKIFTRNTENDLNYTELINMRKSSNETILIDVRSNQEYNEGHLNGAINIPIYEIEEKIQTIVRNKDTIIIVYCQSGARSKKAKKILEKLEYKNVYNLKGGIDNL